MEKKVSNIEVGSNINQSNECRDAFLETLFDRLISGEQIKTKTFSFDGLHGLVVPHTPLESREEAIKKLKQAFRK